MKLHKAQVERVVRHVFLGLQERKLIEFKISEKQVYEKAIAYVEAESKREDDLVREVNQMLDNLEKTNAEGFDRRKMFTLLKNKLAKDKGIILSMEGEEIATHLAHVITDKIWNDDIVEYVDEDEAIKVAKKAVREFFDREESLDEAVRTKILSQKKGIFEGSREYDILYKKYYEEEARKRGV